jgi:hypothetical protein
MVRVVTTDVGRRPCPIPYPRICMLYAQSPGPMSDTNIIAVLLRLLVHDWYSMQDY